MASVLRLRLTLTVTVLFDKPLMSPPFPCLGLVWDQGRGCCFLPYQHPAEPDINRSLLLVCLRETLGVLALVVHLTILWDCTCGVQWTFGGNMCLGCECHT